MCASYNSLILDTDFMCDFLSLDQYKIIDAKNCEFPGHEKLVSNVVTSGSV